LLDRQAIETMVGGTAYRCGAFDSSCATIHPAKLVRGLRRVALERGAAIYEHSPLRRLVRGKAPQAVTPHGRVEARHMVLAMNAWSLAIPELRRGIFVITSDDAVSAPAPAFLARHRWQTGPLITNSAVFVSGYRPTADGRIVAGVTGGAIGVGTLARQRYTGASPRARQIAEAFGQGFQDTEGVTWTASWRGPIDRTLSGLPVVGRLPGEDRIFFGYGFSGNGIVGSYLGAEILRSLVLEQHDMWSGSSLVGPPQPWMPREPLRSLGAYAVRWAVRQKDRFDSSGRRQGRIAARLAGLAPGGIVTTPTRR
jgi:glycine/D-amino acid oxidase-like deaminating enzyme